MRLNGVQEVASSNLAGPIFLAVIAGGEAPKRGYGDPSGADVEGLLRPSGFCVWIRRLEGNRADCPRQLNRPAISSAPLNSGIKQLFPTCEGRLFEAFTSVNKFPGVFIIVGAAASLAAFLTYQPRTAAVLEQSISQVAAVTDAAMQTVLESPPAPVAATPAVATGAGLAQPPGSSGRPVRVPAIREAQNYGWVQLPHGARVHLVETRHDGFLIRYDESYLVVPRAAVETGAVILRPRAGQPAS